MSEREGRELVKKDTTSRVRRGFSKIKKGLSLPKIRRARGQDLAKERKAGKAKKIKEKKKEKDVAARVSPPKPNNRVKTILDSKAFSLVLGEDFNSSQSLTFPDVKEILEKLSVEIKEDEKLVQVKSLLSEPQGEGKGESYAAAKELLIDVLGSAKFNVLFSKAIKEQLNANSESFDLDIKLVRALDANVVLYTGIDRNLEDTFQHDNVPVLSLTPVDLLTFEEKEGSLLNGIKESNPFAKIIIKPYGDYSKADSVLISNAEKFKIFGLDLNGKELDKESTSDVTKALVKLVSEVLTRDNAIILGKALTKEDPLSFLFQIVQQQIVTSAEEGVEVKPKHVALVTKTKSGEERLKTSECGIEYFAYEKDETTLQITEYMSFMVGDRTAIPKDIAPNKTLQVAADDTAYPEFLVALSKIEENARVINIFTNNLIDVPFLENAKRLEKIRKKIAQLQGDEYADKVVEGLESRREVFNNIILPKEDKSEEVEEEVEKKDEVEAKEEVNNTIVRVIYPESAAKKFIETAKAKEIEVVSRIADAIKESNGKLEVRFVDDSSIEGKVAEKFEVLYLNSEATLGDFGLYHTVYTAHFPVSFFEVNSNTCEEKTLLFERLLISAGEANESISHLNQVVAEANASLEARSKGKTTKKGVKAETEYTEASKSKRPGLVKRIVRTVSSTMARKPSKNAISTPAIEEVKAAAEEAEKEEAEKKEEAVEEVKEEDKKEEAVEEVKEEEKKEEAVEETKEVEQVEEKKAAEEENVEEKKEEVAEEKKEEGVEEKKEEEKEAVEEKPTKSKKKWALFGTKKGKKKPAKEEKKEDVEEKKEELEEKKDETAEEKKDEAEVEEKKEEVEEAKEEEKKEETAVVEEKKEEAVEEKKEETAEEKKEETVEDKKEETAEEKKEETVEEENKEEETVEEKKDDAKTEKKKKKWALFGGSKKEKKAKSKQEEAAEEVKAE